MEFVVKIRYNEFKFTDKNDAIIFAEIAKAHSADPDIWIQVELHRPDETPKEDTED